MKKLWVVVVVSLLAMNSYAQDNSGNTETQGDRVENPDNKTDDSIDTGLEKVGNFFFGKKKKAKKDATKEQAYDRQKAGKFFGMMKAINEPVEYQKYYAFDRQVEMKVTNTSKKGKVEENHLHLLIPHDDATHWGMAMLSPNNKKKDDRSVFIYDTNNKAVISLNEERGEKSGVAMAMDMDQMTQDAIDAQYEEAMEKGEAPGTEVAFVKTGKTKNIHGYECEHYMLDSDEHQGEFWIAPDFEHDNSPFFSTFAKQSKKRSKTFDLKDAPTGFIMEMNGKDKKKGTTYGYEVTNISDEDINYEMSHWNVQSIHEMMEQQED
ncbi:DUF4412 domain-containing protein [Persicobacter psychrovividus]|uniref:DUF4412 domain-containing protein n=1 Tax=Persicobacter psychrovividus TaxID=387638 RepID=A0ABM7VFB5_9BACT|nr:hypothetical protein PEPS_19630 [Persicobacter psychrovividus]